ncbi:MAG: ArsA-related P-loop ATPase [Myxococcota bacterium]|nr:ArsA-related P-loop ATPase [Myxococcota bacterium]
MTHLIEKQFVVISGKGGCGRTTVALALGRLCATQRKRTLVCLNNAPSRYFDIVGDIAIDAAIRPIAPQLDVVNLDPRASQEEYGLQILKSRTLHRLIFGSKIVRGFLDAVPGLAEWAMLGKATFHALGHAHTEPEYNIVIFDSPATGHGLDILALPRAIVSAVPTGRMRDEAMARCELLEDPERCEVVPVTLPEEMPVNETIESVAVIRKIGLAVERVVVNRVPVPSRSAAFEKLAGEMAVRSEIPTWALPAAAAMSWEKVQQESIRLLSEQVPVPQICLPNILGGLDETSLLSLVDALAKGAGLDSNPG